jgi:hypothetical protein
VIRYLDELDDEHPYSNNYKLASLFTVDEKVIRTDRKKIVTRFAGTITPDRAMLYVGHYMKDHDKLIRQAEAGLRTAKPGSIAHQQYVRLISDLHTKKVKLLQETGVMPKELGHLNVSEEVWEATVSQTGIIEVIKTSTAQLEASSPVDVEVIEIPSPETS